MSPSFSLRRFATSRLLRVTAMLAWLLMAISLPAVSAHAMTGEGSNATGMASMMMDHAMHADASATDSHHADHCCGDTTHVACHCDAMCGAALLPSVPALHGPARLAALQLPLRGIAAPTLQLTPPLRPPAV